MILPYARILCFAIGSTVTVAACTDKDNPEPQESEPQARPAKIVQLAQNGVSLQRTYPGTLEASQKADLAFRVSGQLIELPATPGLRVKTGDILARLDPKDFDNIVAERRARFDLAKTQQERASKLVKQNLSSKLNFDQANAELKTARAALQQARDNLVYSELKAPFDGTVARINIENFQSVRAQEPLIQLRQDDELAIRFSVPETVLARLRRVEDPTVIQNFCGRVSFATHPDKQFKACYKEHESIPDPITRNYSALFSLDRITGFVALPGMTATIHLDFSEFLADRSDRSIFAPVEAVFSENDKQWLWSVDENMRAHKVEVTVGRIEGEQVQITGGIDPQSHIIAAGVGYVREGMWVKPLVKQRGL